MRAGRLIVEYDIVGVKACASRQMGPNLWYHLVHEYFEMNMPDNRSAADKLQKKTIVAVVIRPLRLDERRAAYIHSCSAMHGAA